MLIDFMQRTSLLLRRRAFMRAALQLVKSTRPANMANYFSGVHLALADLSSDSKARVLFTKQVKTGGGNVMIPRPGAFFGCKGPLPDEITHVIVDSTEVTSKQLQKKLNCNEIANNVQIVNTKWLIDCVSKSSHLDESGYPVKVIGDDGNIVKKDNENRVVGEKCQAVLSSLTSSSSSSSQIEDTEKIIKKLKKDGLSSTSPKKTITGIKGKYPIIPNPIAFPDFIPNYNVWKEYKSVMYKFQEPDKEAKVTGYIAFDMDGTLITPKSGKTFGIDEFDWKYWDKSVPEILQRHHREGRRIAIISNQNGIKSKNTTRGEVQRKVDSIIKSIGIPIDFICALDDDGFKKPRTGMWDILRSVWDVDDNQNNNSGLSYMYVGDAAGRPKENTHKKDFSDTDLKMAINAGIPFETPEKFFLSSVNKLHCQFDLKESFRLCDMPILPEPSPSIFTPVPGVREIVLIVSPPACGKTKLSKKFDPILYSRINQDTLKTIDKCLIKAKEELNLGKNVVVDNTNISNETRAKWISLAKSENIKIRCVVLKTSKEVCFSLATFRLADPRTSAEDRREIGRIVIHSGFKQFVMPSEKDFDRIDEINWSPDFPKTSSFIKGIPTEHSVENLAEQSTETSIQNSKENCEEDYKEQSKEDSEGRSEEGSVGIYDTHRPLESYDDIAMKLMCSYLK